MIIEYYRKIQLILNEYNKIIHLHLQSDIIGIV